MKRFNEALHEAAYDLALSEWKVRFRRFMLVEFPGACAFLALALNLDAVTPQGWDAPQWVHTCACIVAVAVLVWVWATRLPPERPALYDSVVLSAVDRMAFVAAAHPPLQTGPIPE